MGYAAPLTVITGDLATAAQYNTYTKDNVIAMYAGGMSYASQAIGDLVCPTSTTQLGAIAAVASGQVLTSAGTGTKPAWSADPVVDTITLDGVLFPDTQVASADANMLDDYEEGTWTPLIGGISGESGQTYTTQNGNYTKIGRKVTLTFHVVMSVAGTISGAYLNISGMPFTPTDSNQAVLSLSEFGTLAVNWIIVTGGYGQSADAQYINGRKAATPGSAHNLLVPADAGNGTWFKGSVVYDV